MSYKSSYTGAQIDAAIATASTYATGTWTPVLGGTGGATGQTYTKQNGTYTKIGKMVVAQCYIALSSKGTFVGPDYITAITGLPFACGASEGGATVGYFAGLATNKVMVSAYISGGSIILTAMSSAAQSMAAPQIPNSDITNTTQIILTVVYTSA